MTWDKFWKYVTNTAKTIWILILIGVGIKVLLWLIFSLVPYKPFFPFEQPDWNPVATIVGAVLTLTGTCIAVVWTAKLDRDARLHELKYKNYLDNLKDFKELIKPILRLTFYFEKNSSCSVNKKMDDSVLNKDSEIRQFQRMYNDICRINPAFKPQVSDFEENFKSFVNIYQFLKQQFCEHTWYYVKQGDEKYKKKFIIDFSNEQYTYNGEEFLDLYKQKTGIDYDVYKMITILENLKSVIEDEFVLEK